MPAAMLHIAQSAPVLFAADEIVLIGYYFPILTDTQQNRRVVY